ncbi:MAG: GlsB/YeaQ/YmgE family stress response membrane protein [Prevotellaceae bacterium]|jgi:uncharacterized membrane protein YeaQ/YmgE (transglycosylase-associated protein family)|nr:GlsB/YeaQ/YmgE family stress response membrane protein [Prevotellaceae bacterium]
MWNFILFIAVGAVAGWLAGVIMKGRGFGFLINLLIGIVGGFLGGWLFGLLGIGSSSLVGGLIAAVVGAVILLWIISLFKKK